MALQDLIAAIGDKGEREQLATLMEKYAPVKAALERGDAVGTAFEQVQALGLNPAVEMAALPEWVNYRAKHWNPTAQKWDFMEALEQDRNGLRARVQALEAERGTEMTGEEVKALANQLFEDRLKALREDPENPLIDKKILVGSMGLQAGRFEEVDAALETKSFEHYDKFKQPLPKREIYDYMKRTGERDVLKAYGEVIKPLEHQAEIARLKADADKRFEEGKAKGVEEAQAKINGQRMPVDGGGGARSGSHFMNRVFKRREAAANPGNQRLGSGTAASEGFAEYQKKLMGAGSV
jgi:hypothetical protein